MTFDQWVSLSKQAALIIFFVTFVGIVAWAFWPGNRNKFDQIGKDFLKDEEDPDSHKPHADGR